MSDQAFWVKGGAKVSYPDKCPLKLVCCLGPSTPLPLLPPYPSLHSFTEKQTLMGMNIASAETKNNQIQRKQDLVVTFVT